MSGIKAVLESNEKFAEMQSAFNISKKQLQAIVEQVLRDARNFKQAKENEPLLKPSSAEPKQVALPASKPIILDPKKSANGRIRFLYNFIDAEINGDRDYITTRPISTYEMVIDAVRITLESKESLAKTKEIFNLSEKQLEEILGKVMEDAAAGLKESKGKTAEQIQKLPISESVAPQSGPWPKYPSEEEVERVERIADVNFFNQSQQLVTLWVPFDNTFEMVKLLPGNGSKIFALKKSGEQAYMYLAIGNFVIIPQEGSITLYKEDLASRHGGKGLEQFTSLKLIQTLSIQKADRVPSIQITVKPDLSITLSQSN